MPVRKKLPPTHPGELLRDEIINEKRGVSADMAHRLARMFDTTPDFWLGLQQDVDLWRAEIKKKATYQKIRPLKKVAA